jgi:tRNA 2-thiouridine synthesizing protein E
MHEPDAELPDLALDAEGYLVDALAWTPDVAERLAGDSGLPRLTAEHWKVLFCYREAHARERRSPSVAALAELAGIPIAELRRLFPFRTAELVARLAGLSKPAA